jgi:hypothetical protein
MLRGGGAGRRRTLTSAAVRGHARRVSLLVKLKALFGSGSGSGGIGSVGGGARTAVSTGWSIAKVVNAGVLRGVVRLRTDRPALPPGRAFATSVTVAWHYAEDGLPTDVQGRAMGGFEAALDELVEDNGHAFLMRVRTGFGAREWLFYTVDSAPFMARFNALLAGHEAYPLEILFAQDPTWSDWESSLGELGAARPARQ